MLETATAQGGSATTATRKKRQHVVVNGRQYLRLDQIGRGGSAKVYKVMAENFKMLAMKKVSLDKQDEASIRGFKQEIDLLERLENEDRVVHIYDYEVNDEKGTLTVVKLHIRNSITNIRLTIKPASRMWRTRSQSSND